MLKIPIIILNWNGWEDTLECLGALMEQSVQNFTIYLVDNGSKDESVVQLKKYCVANPKIKLILNQENLGFTRGNNSILKDYILSNPAYKYVVLLNNDTVPNEDWLENLVQSAEENNADIVSSKMIDYFEPEKMDNAGHMMLNTGEILPIGHGKPVDNYTRGFENMGACAGAALYSTDMLRDIGIFDEHFNTGYEDAELGARAVVTGYKCWFEPTAIIHHKMGQSIKKIFNYDYSLMIQKHILYSYFKLMPFAVILIMIPFFLIKYTLMLIIGLLFWRLKYLKIMFQVVKGTLWDDFSIIIHARKNFYSRKKRIPSIAILPKLTFFLWFDIMRFYKYFIKNQLSSFDVYGKVKKAK